MYLFYIILIRTLNMRVTLLNVLSAQYTIIEYRYNVP